MKFGMTRMSHVTPSSRWCRARKALGHSRDAVRLLDAERHDLGIGRIASEQRDVGAVQRGDDARHACRVWRSVSTCLRQIRRGGMRNRVVRVHDVELLVARHLHDLGGQRQQILRLAKQRIARRLDAVERQPGLVVAQAATACRR